MSQGVQDLSLFEEDVSDLDRGESDPEFVVDLGAFEGPLDLLLELARRQTVDLAKISILELAEQYLAFIESNIWPS
jgi:segregation and condensation protein A